MEFKKDKPYSFPELMAYGFYREEQQIIADCHLYLGENSFDAMLSLTESAFKSIITGSDDKSGKFEKACMDWFESNQAEIFLPDTFPEPVHCKINGLQFRFEKVEKEDDDFGPEHIFYFSLEPENA